MEVLLGKTISRGRVWRREKRIALWLIDFLGEKKSREAVTKGRFQLERVSNYSGREEEK